jgi:hypothetical protein
VCGSNRSNAVIATAYANNGIRSGLYVFVVEMRFTACKIEDAAARCSKKIASSTEALTWAMPSASGGYTVHLIPAPRYTILIVNNESEVLAFSCISRTTITLCLCLFSHNIGLLHCYDTYGMVPYTSSKTTITKQE